MSKIDMVVAKKYQLLVPKSIKDGTWDLNGSKKLIHDNKILPRFYVEQRNDFNNNELYVIDEVATAEMLEKREENIKKQAEQKKRENITMADLVDTVAKGQSKK